MGELFSPINLMVLAAIIHYGFEGKNISEPVRDLGEGINDFNEEIKNLREQAPISNDADAQPLQFTVAPLLS